MGVAGDCTMPGEMFQDRNDTVCAETFHETDYHPGHEFRIPAVGPDGNLGITDIGTDVRHRREIQVKPVPGKIPPDDPA